MMARSIREEAMVMADSADRGAVVLGRWVVEEV